MQEMYVVRLKRTPAISMTVSRAGDLGRQLGFRSASYSAMCVSRWGALEGKGMLRTRLCVGLRVSVHLSPQSVMTDL